MFRSSPIRLGKSSEFQRKKFCTGIKMFLSHSRRFKASLKLIKKIDFLKIIQWSYPLSFWCTVQFSLRDVYTSETSSVPKCPKFCCIFIVIIFLEEIDQSSGKLIPHGFKPCSFQIQCLFLATMRRFLIMAVNTEKTEKIVILIQFFPFVIRNYLIDRSSHLDLVA